MSDNEKKLYAILSTIFEMSDRVERAGGTASISRIAAGHAMQESIQKNKARVVALFAAAQKGPSDECAPTPTTVRLARVVTSKGGVHVVMTSLCEDEGMQRACRLEGEETTSGLSASGEGRQSQFLVVVSNKFTQTLRE